METRIRTSEVATITSVASANSDTALLAANKARKTLIIQNTSTAILYVSLGSTAATATSGHSIQLASNAYVILEGYTGAVRGIWAAVNGQANLTELS